jgi:hypothetical protein
MYLSSAYYQDHWSYTRVKDSCRFMLDETKHNFVCGFPYQLGIVEGILLEDEVQEQMMETDFNEISWSISISVLLKPIELLLNRCISNDKVFRRKLVVRQFSYKQMFWQRQLNNRLVSLHGDV